MGKLQTIAQVVLFGVILYLIGVQLFRRTSGTSMGQAATSGATFGFLAAAMLVVVLPCLTSLSFEGFGVKGQVAMEAARAVSKGAVKAGGAALASKRWRLRRQPSKEFGPARLS